jgi:hypothetical protein
MSADKNWNDLLAEFRALGGVADNVTLGSGRLGRGLFPMEPGKPSRLHVPENLLINVSDVHFDGGRLKVKPGAVIPERERAFFEFFEEEYSWGAGDKKDCEEFFARVADLPENVRTVLTKDFGLKGFEAGTKAGQAESRFLRSRMMTYGKRYVLMPVLEIANHGVNGCSFQTKEGVGISGTFTEEVLAHYGMVDPFGAFEVWGFTSNEPLAFSLPATLALGKRKLTILRQLSNKKVRGNFRIPVLSTDEDKVTVSHLMLGHARYPRLSKGIFYQFMQDLGEPNGEELYDRIRRFNVGQFLKLMEALDAHEGAMISTLRQLCRHQIGAISHAVGSRTL